MAQNDVPVTNQSEVEERLKHLEFVETAVLHAVVSASKAYGYAKNNSGPLKPGVETIEATLKTVVGPTYHKFPVELLKFVDHKVDESVNKFDPFVRYVSAKTKNLSTEVKTVGLAKTAYSKLEPAAKGLYTKYEPVAEQYAVSAWQSLNRLLVFPKVVVPTAAYCAEKYNQSVQQTAEKGYKVSFYLPLVPTDRIAKVFNPVEPQVVPGGGEGVVVAH